MGAVQQNQVPGAVLFVCTANAVRSPMAAALMRAMTGGRVHVQSAGVRAEALDPLAALVMDEIGVVLADHRPCRLQDLQDGFFDLVVSLSPEAHSRALEMTRTAATPVEYWPIPDATAVEGGREQRLAAYRAVRDALREKLRVRFARVTGA